MSEFFHMGGYATYVWSSYALAALMMAAVFTASWISWKRNEKTLSALKALQGSRKASKRAA